MRILMIVVVALVVAVTTGCTGYVDPNKIVDDTGLTSIVAYMENGDWVELRGPGRFDALEYFGDIVE